MLEMLAGQAGSMRVTDSSRNCNKILLIWPTILAGRRFQLNGLIENRTAAMVGDGR